MDWQSQKLMQQSAVYSVARHPSDGPLAGSGPAAEGHGFSLLEGWHDDGSSLSHISVPKGYHLFTYPDG